MLIDTMFVYPLVDAGLGLGIDIFFEMGVNRIMGHWFGKRALRQVLLLEM